MSEGSKSAATSKSAAAGIFAKISDKEISSSIIGSSSFELVSHAISEKLANSNSVSKNSFFIVSSFQIQYCTDIITFNFTKNMFNVNIFLIGNFICIVIMY